MKDKLITDGSVALEDPADYDCIVCESSVCKCSTLGIDGRFADADFDAEFERIMSLSDAEVDTELRAEGIDPSKLSIFRS